MKVFRTNQIKAIDDYTIEHEPIESIDLMERAATALFTWFSNRYSENHQVKIFCGPGNNGGDGMALARLLIIAGFKTHTFYLKSDSYTSNFTLNLERLKGLTSEVHLIKNHSDFPAILPGDLVIDALYGSGLSRPVEGMAAQLIEHINSSHAKVISIDIPSGLFGEANPFPNTNPVIKADYCLSFQFPKLAFFMPENEQFVKQWAVLHIGLHPLAIENTPTSYFYTVANSIRAELFRLSTFAHKGTFGHALVLAGSYGMMGAACLCAKSAIRSGTGLVTMHVPEIGYQIAQLDVPEALTSVDSSDTHLTEFPTLERYNAIAVGPGIAQSSDTGEMLFKLIKSSRAPLVIDADGLNLLSRNIDILSDAKAQVILTPHPGEFDKLFGKSQNSWQRLELASEMAKKFNAIIVLKGAYTRVVLPNGNVHFNSTGNPGMATGGSGDVLTGIITGLLAHGLSPTDAAITGVFIHGLAGDLAADDFGKISLCASDIVSYICKAFNHITKNNE
ncbi:MAG TPA: bifunctional ADP-dependent NAD(P)H-hydrate dehydratase/NAD(P)H-hydrate epimerase [Bacteroidales bacterium]|nr:bifunctional ADP-dependent NAD(P)H-hydrate dehydratase/NAD(P)H-hydrate epimerase [Bacteroidales bacterium]